MALRSRTKYGMWGGHVTHQQLKTGMKDWSSVQGDYGPGPANVLIVSDDRQLDFKKAIRLRNSATTFLSASGLTWTRGSLGTASAFWRRDPLYGDDTDQYKAFGDFVNFENVLPAPVDPTLMDGLENQALMHFISKANAVQRQFQAGVFLGELRETIHQIRHPAQSIRNHLSDYLSTVKKRGRTVLRSNGRYVSPNSHSSRSRGIRGSMNQMVSDSWLEFNFGVMPLVNDVHDAAVALARYNYDSFPSKVVRGAANAKTESVHTTTASASAGTAVTKYRRRFTASVKIYGAVAVQSQVGAAHLASLTGFTFRDIVPTLWELIPYSFVADYFSNIGAIVEAGCFNTSTVAWANIGRYLSSSSEQIDQQLTPVPSPNGSYIRERLTFTPSGPFAFTEFQKVRQVYTGGYMPSLAFTIPGMKQSFNLAALFGQSKAISSALSRRG